MKPARLDKKGRLTVPRSILRKAGITGGTTVLMEVDEVGAIVIRPAPPWPIEMYSDVRVREFLKPDVLDPDQEHKLRETLRTAG